MRLRLLALLAVLLAVAASAPVAVSAAAPVRSGALTWQRPQLTDPLGGFTSVSCVTRKVCRAGSGNSRLERWDGRHWTPGATLPA